MPQYNYKCPACGHMHSLLTSMKDFVDAPPCPDCGTPSHSVITARPMIASSFQSYQCPVTGKPIGTKTAHEENLKRQGCRIYETGETEETVRRKAREEKAFDAAVEGTVEKFFATAPTAKRERLAQELNAGADASVTRG